MTTHMAVTTAVKTGMVTMGLGIYSAAKALDLDFMDITFEDYDFLLPCKMLNDPMINKFIEVLKSKEFQDRVESLGGYEFGNTGEILYIE